MQIVNEWEQLFAGIVETGRKLGIAALLMLLFVVVMSTQALAAPMFRGMGTNGKPASLTLHDEVCAHPKIAPLIAEKVKPEYAQGWRRAVLYWDDRDWESCWKEINKIVYSIDEEGAPFRPVPRMMFREGTI